MSYARFGDDSSVYVFANASGPLTCCGCLLGDAWDFWTTAEMLVHLEGHRRAGHRVPDYCFEGLRTDEQENDERAAKIHGGMCSGCDGTGECRDYMPHDVEGSCTFCKGTKKCWRCGGSGSSATPSERFLAVTSILAEKEK